MEGPLSKWTNMVHGWQYRWFKLEKDALLYYTSREKMMKSQQRGCMRLCGAVVGIDGENNSLFTVSIDGKVFHLQGRDEGERNRWVKVIDNAIRECSGYKRRLKEKESVIESLKQKTLEADQYLHNIIQQVKDVEVVKDVTSLSEKDRRTIDALLGSTTNLLNTVKHASILLTMARTKLEKSAGSTEGKSPAETRTEAVDLQATTADNGGSTCSTPDSKTDNDEPRARRPPISYSSSDEDEFYDADEELVDLDKKIGKNSTGMTKDASATIASSSNDDGYDFGDSHEDFDAIYDNPEEQDVGNVQQEHGSVIVHLLSQVSVGMDLTKVTLPTFILERRSLLEMYADFFAHPDKFIATPSLKSPEERMICVVKYYLNAFYAARKSGVAKKPYNPILGETFRCRYTVPGLAPSGIKTEAGPFPGSDINQVTFVAEQVSHHPPISAFYAEMPALGISFNAHIYTKSSFLGLSIGVANIGEGVVRLHNLDEDYVVTFPNGYGRSIMSTPWVELGGKVKVTCEKTGYQAHIEFLTKPFFGGKPHRIQGAVYKDGSKKPILTVRGEWNNVMFSKDGAGGEEKTLIDVKADKEVKKECVPVMQQGERESRRLWRHVTAALLRNRIETATTSKRMIEQRQRQEAKERLESGQKWRPALFSQDPHDEDSWYFNEALGSKERSVV